MAGGALLANRLVWLAVAAALHDYFADGVTLVELAALRDPAQLVTTIGHAVVILGFNTVRNLALAISTFDTFDVGLSGRTLNLLR